MKQLFARAVLHIIRPALDLSVARPASDRVMRFRRADLTPEVLAYADHDVLTGLLSGPHREFARRVSDARKSALELYDIKQLIKDPERAEFVWLDLEDRVLTGMAEIEELPSAFQSNPDYMRVITSARASLESARRLWREAGHPESDPAEGGANDPR